MCLWTLNYSASSRKNRREIPVFTGDNRSIFHPALDAVVKTLHENVFKFLSENIPSPSYITNNPKRASYFMTHIKAIAGTLIDA